MVILQVDVFIIYNTGKQVDIEGIDNHQVKKIPFFTAGIIFDYIAIIHQHAYEMAR